MPRKSAKKIKKALKNRKNRNSKRLRGGSSNNYGLHQPLVLPKTREPPQLPPEIWFIIMKAKKDVEEYEKTLTIQELYPLILFIIIIIFYIDLYE